MKELEDIGLLVKGGLLEEKDAKVTTTLLFGDAEEQPMGFTSRELFKIYVDVKCRFNFAPEELEDFEIELATSIINKIENHARKG